MNTDLLDDWILSLARGFLTRYYRQEADGLPEVWKAVLLYRRREQPPAGSGAGEGLPFARDATPLASPFAILAVESVLIELRQRGETPDESKIAKAVEAAAVSLGATRKLVRELRAFLPGRIVDLFNHHVIEGSSDDGIAARTALPTTVSSGDRPIAANEARPDEVFVERSVDGQKRKTGWASIRVRGSNLRNTLYDLVVDEVERRLIIRDRSGAVVTERAVGVGEIERRAAAMLWLALVNFGGSVRFDELAFRVGSSLREQPDIATRVKSALGRLLGTGLRDQLLGAALNGTYPVNRENVNYCWMLVSEDKKKSFLYQRTC